MTTPTPAVPVYPLHERDLTPTRPSTPLARRRRAGDALLALAFVIGLISAMSLWVPGVLGALALGVIGARLSPRWAAYVDAGRVTWE